MPESPSRRPLVVAALLLAVAMSAMEATVVATAMPTIVGDLGGVSLYGWVGAAYLLATTVSVPLFGRLADLHGRKPVLLAGIAMFVAGSVACGLAPTIELLVAGRALQGLGAGAMQPVSLTLVGDLYGIEERARIQGLFGAVWGVSGIAGPVLGGLIVASWSWPWVFFVNVPFGVLSAVVLAVVFREDVRGRASGGLDVGGAAVLALASVCLLLGAEGTVPLVTVPAGLALGIAFVAVEARVRAPIVPISLVVRRHIAVATLSSVLMGVTLMGTLLYLPLYVQGVLGGSPAEAGGVVIAPMMIGWPVFATGTSRFLVRLGFRAPVLVGGTVCATALVALAAALHVRAPEVALGAATFAYGAGMGVVNTALIVAIQSSVGFGERGVATALNQFARSMGGALGVGALGGLLALRLEGRMTAEQVAALLARTPGVELPDPGALGEAMGPMFPLVAGAALLNLVVLAFWPRRLEPGPA